MRTKDINRYRAFNNSEKQYAMTMNCRADFGRAYVHYPISIISIEEWQYSDEDKKAIADGTKKAEDCKKTIYAANGKVRRIYSTNNQIPTVEKTIRDRMMAVCSAKHKHPQPKNWTPNFKDPKPWTNVDALHGYAMYNLKKWDDEHPEPDAMLKYSSSKEIVQMYQLQKAEYDKMRSDAFSRIVTNLLNRKKLKTIYRVLIYGHKDYSIDDKITFYYNTFSNYETAMKEFINQSITIKRKYPKLYDRAEITAFNRKFKSGFKIMDYDQRGHISEILLQHRKKIDLSWYTTGNACKIIPIKKRPTLDKEMKIAA